MRLMALGCASIFACSLSPLWQPLCVSCGSNQFIGVQFWGVARKKVQRQHALRGGNIAGLVSALQRLLWRQSQLGEQTSHRRHTKPNGKFPFDQVGYHRARPQAKI
jgi:hypothetical protein